MSELPEDERPPYRAGELLQTASTIAALALALATLADESGPEVDGLYLIRLTLLFAGSMAVVGALYALSDLVREFGEVPPLALRYTQAGLYVTGAAYAWLLVDGVP